MGAVIKRTKLSIVGSGSTGTSQYSYNTNPNDGLQIRSGWRDNAYVIDKEITATGFAGSQDTDWEQIGGAN